jgi:hypothetical protein
MLTILIKNGVAPLCRITIFPLPGRRSIIDGHGGEEREYLNATPGHFVATPELADPSNLSTEEEWRINQCVPFDPPRKSF